MQLFHQLDHEDQQNAIHYCMHIIVEDMLEDGVEIEPFSEEDRKMKTILEQVVAEAKQLPQEEQFAFIVHHEEAGPYIFDISLDMARGTYYHPDDDMVIFHESLRNEVEADGENIDNVEELTQSSKKNDHNLN